MWLSAGTSLGCTEPASIALAAAHAAGQASGPVRAALLTCDARLFKNCHAVGIPHSGHRTGILQALAIGSLLPDPSAGLECFRQITPEILAQADALLASGSVKVQVEPGRRNLLVDCQVVRAGGVGRAVIEEAHTHLVRLERDGLPQPLPPGADPRGDAGRMAEVAAASFGGLIQAARSLSPEDRAVLRQGVELNLAIARHGLTLLPRPFMDLIGLDPLTRISRLVCAGVYARMSGADFTVMTLAGSGNKGITCAVPLALWGRECAAPQEAIDEALALACLMTAAATARLGALSSVCGCSNAAGIGLAAGLVLLQGGGEAELSMAVTNMVGNVTGMICDGAKIGCGLKTMTAVDAAFRAASLAMAGLGIPPGDGIVGRDGRESLDHLERVAVKGMAAMEEEILRIMQGKLGG